MYCGETPIFKIGCPSRWISFNHEWNEAYFISNKGLIYTINEEGKEPISACSVPYSMKFHLFKDPWGMVMTKNRNVIFWASVDGHGFRSKVSTLVSIDLATDIMLTSVGYNIEHNDVHGPIFLFSRARQKMIKSKNMTLYGFRCSNKIGV